MTEQILPITELTDKRLLVTIFETVECLGWRIRFMSDAGVIAYTQNGEHSWNGEITVKLDKGQAIVRCESTTNPDLDYGKSNAAVQEYISAFEKLKDSIGDDEVRQKYKEYKKDFLPPYEDTLKPDIAPKFGMVHGFFSFFKPIEGYYVTPILINLNILVYLVMVCTGISVFEPDAQRMIAWGANSTIETLGGQWWRLLTNCFLHFGLIHLLMNMYALFFVGFFLEPFLGKAKFITAYLLTGIIASLASLWWHDYTISAGASGAIFGLYGVFLALLTTNHIEKNMRKGLLLNIGIFVVYNLFNGSVKGGIDNAAHIGGLLSGILIGYALVPALQRPDDRKISQLTIALITVVTIAASVAFSYPLSHNDKLEYEKGIQSFYHIEDNALKVLKDKEEKPNQELLPGFTKGITDWVNSIQLIKKLDQLKISGKQHVINGLLIDYCQLRLQSYELILQDIKQENDVNHAQILAINDQIRQVLDKLRGK